MLWLSFLRPLRGLHYKHWTEIVLNYKAMLYLQAFPKFVYCRVCGMGWCCKTFLMYGFFKFYLLVILEMVCLLKQSDTHLAVGI